MKHSVWISAVLGCIVLSIGRSDSVLAQEQQDSCMTCHRALPAGRLLEPAKLYPDDIHSVKGFGCIACHGGDATLVGPAAMDPEKGYIGAPERQRIPSLCGRCHSNAQFMKRFNPALRVDQAAEYETSAHGQRLRGNDDPNVATCTGCHVAHSIKPASDPRSSVHPLNVAETCGSCHADPARMQPYGIPTDQLDQYQTSVHWGMISDGGDLSAPTCNDCHGNHGAAPPGVSWVGNVCGQCHAMMADLFNQSRHARVFALLGRPGCATCHGNHRVQLADDEMLGLGEGAVCATCHTDEDPGGQTALAFRTAIDSLRTVTEEADALLLRAENAGMEVSQALFELNGAEDALIKVRATVHSFDIGAVNTEMEAGLEIAAEAQSRGQEALADLRFRRLGLVASVVIIVVLIVGLVMKIREIEHGGDRT